MNMTRNEFTRAYRAARVALNTFASSRGTLGRYANMSLEQKRMAEESWIRGVQGPFAAAYLAVSNSHYLGGSISSAAIYDYRFCGGHRKQWYLRMARNKRAA